MMFFFRKAGITVKKAVSVLLAICICLATFSSMLFALADTTVDVKTVDLKKSVRIGSDADKGKIAVSYNGDNMIVGVENYNANIMSGDTPLTSKLWLKGVLLALKYSDDSLVFLENGKEYIINVVYSVDRTNGATFFPSIGVVYNDNTNAGNALTQDNGSYMIAGRNHTSTGEFSISATKVQGNGKPLRLAFYGVGQFTVKSVTLSTVSGEVIDLTKSEAVSVSGSAFKDFSPATDTAPLKITSTRGVDNEMFDGQNQWVNNWSKTPLWIKGGIVTLKRKDGSYLTLKKGRSYTVSVTYKITKCDTTDTKKDPKICLVYNNNNAEANYAKDNGTIVLAGARLYSYGNNLTDNFNKTLTFTSKAINGDDLDGRPLRLAFSGLGTIEVSSVKVSEIDGVYSVTYVDGGISTAEYVEKGGKLKTPKREDFIFDGWYDNPECTGDPITEAKGDITVYAKWKADGNKIVISFIDEIGNGSGAVKFSVGDTIDRVPEKQGYKFLGWYKYQNYLGRPVTTAQEDIITLYAKWENLNAGGYTYVDLSKNSTLITTGKTADSKAEYSNGALNVYVYNYERQLHKTDAKNSDTWFPAYYFKDSNGKFIQFTTGETYELEVEYKVVKVQGGDDVGLQIGFGVDFQNNANRTRTRGYKYHSKADVGKEFSYSVSYTVDNLIYPKLLFSGQGNFEIKSIKIRKKEAVVKDTVIGIQTYEDYSVGKNSGVVGDAKGIEVTDTVNHTAAAGSKKSLKLELNTNIMRLSGDTAISVKQDGKVKPIVMEKGAAYQVKFYLYANSDMDDLTYSINSVGDALQDDYFKYFNMEFSDKISLKKGEWKEIVAKIPYVKGCPAPQNLLSISVMSENHTGSSVYIDDVEVTQCVDSEVLVYNTTGGKRIDPQRAFGGERIGHFAEPARDGYLFDGWYYDSDCKNITTVNDIFPTDKMEITLYAKWIKAPTEAYDFTAGSFDKNIYKDKVSPYTNRIADMDSAIQGYDSETMTAGTAWVEDAGVFGNGISETDGALAFNNEKFSYLNDLDTYLAIRLMNEDGTPFTVVKGERYTLDFDYIFASYKGVSYIIPFVSEKSAYAPLGYDSTQMLKKVSVQETDTDYAHCNQSFIAEKTGYVYLAFTGRDDNAHVDTHAYEKACVDNVSIKRNKNVVKISVNSGNETWFTYYGIKGEKAVMEKILSKDGLTVEGVYTDTSFTKKFDFKYPDKDSTVYLKTKADSYNTPSDFTNPIVNDFEETDLLEVLYRQSKFMTSWSRELTNEWIFETDKPENAFSGNNYIKLNGFNHYWNQAKFALYDVNNPANVILLTKGEKYRVTVMVRCEDLYETPVNMTVCLENPWQRFLLAENGNVKLEYTPKGDKNGYFMFVGDIEVPESLTYLPMLAIRRNANDLQTLFIDSVKVEKLRNCKVEFEENGGSLVDDAEVQIHDPVYDPGDPYKEGFVFDGWYSDKELTKKWDFDNDTVEEDMTLYAKFSVEVIKEEEPEVNPEDETETKFEIDDDDEETVITKKTVSNGEAPNLLDADKVSVKKTEKADSKEDTSFPLWAIILICVGAAVVIAAVIIVLIIVKRKKARR